MMQVAPLLRASEVRALRELIKAAPAGFPYPGHGTLAPKPAALSPIRRAEIAADAAMRDGVGRRMAIELARQTRERGEAAAKTAPISKIPTAGFPAADRAGRCAIERAPEGTIGSAGVGSCEPENVRSPRPKLDRVPHIEDPDDEIAIEFAARIAAASEKRAAILRTPAPIDWNQVADAHARKAMEPQNSHIGPLRPLPVAFSPEECRRCGIPGRKGCAHQAAYVAAQIAGSPYSIAKLHGTRARK